MQLLQKITEIDHRVFYMCASSKQRSLTCKAVMLISKSGDGYLQVLLPLLFIYYMDDEKYLLLEMFIFLNFYERVLYFALKNTLKRKRPPEKLLSFTSIITASDKFSFPSGHTSSAFLMTTIVVVAFGPQFAFLYLWASAVGASRVFLGVHFPSDIIAGATIGTTIALLSTYSFSII